MVNSLKAQIGAAVRAARERAGLTQEELAGRIGRHADSVSLIERGRTQPTIEMLVALADAVGLHVGELIPSEHEPETKSARRLQMEAEIAELLRAVPDSRLEYVRDHLRLLARLA